jgi:hypothetical protein
MTQLLKSELVANEIIDTINSINRTQSAKADVFSLYKGIVLSYNHLGKGDFQEKFDYALFNKRRELLLKINKSELMSLSNDYDDSSSSDNYFQIKCSLLMMINSLKERFNFTLGEPV